MCRSVEGLSTTDTGSIAALVVLGIFVTVAAVSWLLFNDHGVDHKAIVVVSEQDPSFPRV